MARRRALLDAATRLFVEKGFEKTTLSDIIALAGGSRATLYEQFGDKEGLFRAVLEAHQERFLANLECVEANPSLRPEDALTHMARGFLRAMLHDDSLSVLRVLVAEGGRVPGIAETFLAMGPDTTAARVADYLRVLSAKGLLRIDDPAMAARAFLGMIVGRLFLDRLVDPQRAIDPEKEDLYIRRAVRLFLAGAACCPQAAKGPGAEVPLRPGCPAPALARIAGAS
ncbi:TetR/AcrR family transcriptional regulator [Rhodospirillum centenum]|nr:TetR/AcrR family transcriptional regulator [Rhodospirillum centenum]